jgi:hypothetical protein
VDAAVIIVAIAAVCFLGKLLYARRAARRHRADPEVIKHVRLSPEGSGWLYQYGWPARKSRDKHQ